MIALLQGLQNILVRLHHLWSFSQHKCSSINFNTSFQWLIILEEFYYITKKLDCHWLYELQDCCASCCSKSATRAPNSAISLVSNLPCGFVNTPCVLPNPQRLFIYSTVVKIKIPTTATFFLFLQLVALVHWISEHGFRFPLIVCFHMKPKTVCLWVLLASMNSYMYL